jgi:hypothetical protein
LKLGSRGERPRGDFEMGVCPAVAREGEGGWEVSLDVEAKDGVTESACELMVDELEAVLIVFEPYRLW